MIIVVVLLRLLAYYWYVSSVCPVYTIAAACGRFADVGLLGMRYRLIAIRLVHSSNGEQCHVVS